MPDIQTNTIKLLEFLGKKFEDGELDNDSLAQFIEQCGGYLNLMTIPEYAKLHRLTYNGVKKCRKILVIFGVKFVIDNE